MGSSLLLHLDYNCGHWFGILCFASLPQSRVQHECQPFGKFFWGALGHLFLDHVQFQLSISIVGQRLGLLLWSGSTLYSWASYFHGCQYWALVVTARKSDSSDRMLLPECWNCYVRYQINERKPKVEGIILPHTFF